METLEKLTKEFCHKHRFQIKAFMYGELIGNIINAAMGNAETFEEMTNKRICCETKDYVIEMYRDLFPNIPNQLGSIWGDDCFFPIWEYFYDVLCANGKEYKLSHE